MIAGRRILVLSPFESWPLSQGSIVRIHHLLHHLAEHNEVWLAHREGPEHLDAPWLRGRITSPAARFQQLLHPPFLRELHSLVRREQIDLLLPAQLWAGLHAVLLHRLTGVPLLFDHHNVEWLRFRRMGHRAWPGVAALEALVCHSAQSVVCVSDTDRALLQRHLRLSPQKLQVVPNGADVGALASLEVDRALVKQQLGIAPSEPIALFFGSLNHGPNVQAAQIILQEIAPRLQTLLPEPHRIVLAGPYHDKFLAGLREPIPANVHFAGFVDQIAPLIKSADVVLVPLLAGSGTRFKIIESVACARRVISTTVGAEGLARPVLGDSLLICDEWSSFARATAASLRDPVPAPPPPAFAATYDWHAVWQRLTAP